MIWRKLDQVDKNCTIFLSGIKVRIHNILKNQPYRHTYSTPNRKIHVLYDEKSGLGVLNSI